jgi:hypothetical protein
MIIEQLHNQQTDKASTGRGDLLIRCRLVVGGAELAWRAHR